jgi:hypothetical protein
MSQIIGVVGLIGSGKNTVGDYLVDNYNFRHDSFAAPLKDMVAAIFLWDRKLLQGDTDESRIWRDIPDIWWENELSWKKLKIAEHFPHFTPRVCLQIFGTNVMRDYFHPDIWILSLKNRLQRYHSDTVITDCRFINECKIITDLGGKIIRVKRGNDPDWVKFVTQRVAHSGSWFDECFPYMAKLGIHTSEWVSFGWKEDACICNDNTFDYLFDQIDETLNLNMEGVG